MTSPIKGNETPNIEQVIKAAIEARLVDLHTMLPGEILSYDATKQTAKVKLCLKRKYVNGNTTELPVLTGIQVMQLRTKEAFIHLPVKAGDGCMVLFSERSLDIWKKFGGCVDPQDPRKFHLSDCVVIPGLFAAPDKLIVNNPDDLTITNKDATIELIDSGKFRFKKNGGDEVLDLLVQITEKLEETNAELKIATVNTVFGAMQLNNFAQFAILEVQLTTLKNKLDALRGA